MTPLDAPAQPVYGCRQCGAPLGQRHGTSCPHRATGKLTVRKTDARIWGYQDPLPQHTEHEHGQLGLV